MTCGCFSVWNSWWCSHLLYRSPCGWWLESSISNDQIWCFGRPVLLEFGLELLLSYLLESPLESLVGLNREAHIRSLFLEISLFGSNPSWFWVSAIIGFALCLLSFCHEAYHPPQASLMIANQRRSPTLAMPLYFPAFSRHLDDLIPYSMYSWMQFHEMKSRYHFANFFGPSWLWHLWLPLCCSSHQLHQVSDQGPSCFRHHFHPLDCSHFLELGEENMDSRPFHSWREFLSICWLRTFFVLLLTSWLSRLLLEPINY